MSTFPRYYPTGEGDNKWDERDWNAMVALWKQLEASGMNWQQIVDFLNGLTASGIIAAPYSFIIRFDGVHYSATSRNGALLYGGPDDAGGVDGAEFAQVLGACLLAGGLTILSNGKYTPNTIINNPTLPNGSGLIGESADGVEIDLVNIPHSSMSGTIDSGQYAWCVLASTEHLPAIKGFTMRNITFSHANGVCFGIGRGGDNPKTYVNHCDIRHIRFAGCLYGGIFLMDGSNSIIEDLKGDLPWNIISFWYGNESDISIRDVLMRPLLGDYPVIPDDTISFNVIQNAICKNVTIDNVTGDYSLYYDAGGRDFAVGGVIDLAGYGGQAFVNITVKNIVGHYAPSVLMGYGFSALSNALFENCISDHAQNTGGFILKPFTSDGVTFSMDTVTLKNITSKYSGKSGLQIILSSGTAPSATGYIRNLTLDTITMVGNNQNGGTITDYASGVDIGSNKNGIGTIDNLRIINFNAYDDQGVPTQLYPITLWNVGDAGTTFTDIQILGGNWYNNINNTIGKYQTQGNPQPYTQNIKGFNPQATYYITSGNVGASPYYFYNEYDYDIMVSFLGFTYSEIDIIRGEATSQFAGGGYGNPTVVTMLLRPNDGLKIIYTVAGDILFIPQ